MKIAIPLLALFLLAFNYSVTNFDRLVLGSDNYGTDPNPTADITFQNDEYISNSTNGTLDFGAANLTTTGTVTGKLTLNGAFNADSNSISALELLSLNLHTVVAGDSALGKIFLNAADTTLYIGTGTDLVSIADAAP